MLSLIFMLIFIYYFTLFSFKWEQTKTGFVKWPRVRGK